MEQKPPLPPFTPAGMLDLLLAAAYPGLPRQAVHFLYVGDAAGRPPGNGSDKRKKDFSDSDLRFALNCGGAFQVPPSRPWRASYNPYTRP